MQVKNFEFYICRIKRKPYFFKGRKKKRICWNEFEILRCYEGCIIISLGPIGFTWLKGRCR